MKAEELMVGDWVLDTYTNKPMRIEGINGSNPRFGQDLEPIPLTPEILEKNGFRYNDAPFVNGWEQFGLTLYRDGGNGYLINCGINVALIINSVHELQHCLKLVGIDKEIEL